MPLPARVRCRIDRLWDGTSIPDDEVAGIEIDFGGKGAIVRLASPYHDDPAPGDPPGPTDRLWEYEVVEVFLLGSSGYLEVELGPHGHYLAIEFAGRRDPRRRLIPLDYRVTNRSAGRWSATAVLPGALLPEGLDRFNACRIHGTGAARRFLSAFPLPGERPDFHRLECFGSIAERAAGRRFTD